MIRFSQPKLFALGVLLLAACGWKAAAALRELDPKIAAVRQELTSSDWVSKGNDEARKMEKELVGIMIQLNRLLRSHRETAQIEWRLGECHRLGHLLGLPQSWTEAERHLKMALAMDPNVAAAHCSLGQLYLQAGVDYALKAEQEFRKALELATTSPLPEAHKGLFYAYSYQGRFQAALGEAENYQKLAPGDADFEKAKALTLTNLAIQARKKS